MELEVWKQRLRRASTVRPEDLRVVRRAEAAFSAPLGWGSRLRAVVALSSGDRVEAVEGVATAPERADDLVARIGGPDVDDTTFLTSTFAEVLGRLPDPGGLEHGVNALSGGYDRAEYALGMIRSAEARAKELSAVAALAQLPNLMAKRPELYEQAVSTSNPNGPPGPVLHVRSAEDIDWVERMILEHGYYDLPNAWHHEVDTDKQVLGQIIAAFDPARSLELGCSSGAVLSVLDGLGIAAEGIDISPRARESAQPEVKDRIHHGDLLDVDLPAGYDVFCGFDIFEHLNPRRLDRYLERIRDLLRPGGFVVTNIPAYGEDPVFGTAFVPQLVGWQDRDGEYDLWPVDVSGFPHHGHLIWATADWWTKRFANVGFTRVPEVERAIHDRYGGWMRSWAPARRSFFVFSAGPDPAEVAAAAARVAEVPAVAGV